MEIKIATSADIDGINSIRRTVSISDDDHDLNDLTESDILEANYKVTFVAHENECLIGYLNLGDFLEGGRSNISAMMQVFILPEFRNKGIGSKLINAAIRYCDKTKKFQKIILTVLRTNPAHSLYEKIGFQNFKDEEDGVWMFIDVKDNI
ncbi:MAG: GNAT family N-acetyltransferase [Desulfobulbus sp.]|nr:GNAT family N-acetyltransferase [Desulfobulbus sp.]